MGRVLVGRVDWKVAKTSPNLDSCLAYTCSTAVGDVDRYSYLRALGGGQSLPLICISRGRTPSIRIVDLLYVSDARLPVA